MDDLIPKDKDLVKRGRILYYLRKGVQRGFWDKIYWPLGRENLYIPGRMGI